MPSSFRFGLLGRAWRQRLAALVVIDPIERRLGGRAGGTLWFVGGSSLASYPLLPGVVHDDLGAIFGLAAFGVCWGAITFRIDWQTANPLITQASTLAACVSVGSAVAATGATRSGAWVFLFWVVLFACYFYQPPIAIFYIVAAILTQAIPLLYDHDGLHDGFVAVLITGAAGYAAVGGCLIIGKRLIDRTRLRAQALAVEQGAMHRAAAAVLRGDEPVEIYQTVSAELASAIGAPLAGVYQRTDTAELTVVGNWSDGSTGDEPIGSTIEIRPTGAFARALETMRVIRANWLPPEAPARRIGCRSSIVAPVSVGGTAWGVISLASPDPEGFVGSDEQYVSAFADLVAHIVSSLEDRARLATEALTDQLTGLANHRALHQRLAAEAHGASRHGRTLSVAMLDVDNFKELNDVGGHASGDAALRAVADCLRVVVRADDTIGRLGGDEFMWIMPGTDSHEALMAVERVRDLIAAVEIRPKQPTTSAGICDTSTTFDPAELARRADIALYSSKASGRNLATVYEAGVAVGPAARAEWFERSQALVGLRALARAIDAKDPSTSRHSERVADFVGRLANGLGWSPGQVARLREAALVHDVGKLGVPDWLLTKPGPLTDAERLQMNQHAELSARIVGSVLSEEQVSWIRAHHERTDGRGYPRALRGQEIPDGAALIALADAWDVIVVGRPYSARRTPAEAYEECISFEGTQFSATAVTALRRLRESDGIPDLLRPAAGEVCAAAASGAPAPGLATR